MRRAPLLLPAVALIGGILVGHAVHPALSVAIGCIGVAALLLGGMLVLFRRWRVATHLALLLVVAAVGCGLYAWHDERDWTRHCSAQAMMQVRLTSTPQPTARSLRAEAEAVQLVAADGSSVHRVVGRVRLFLRPDSMATALRYGDQLLLHGYPSIERRNIYLTSPHYLLLQRDSTSLRARLEQLRMHLLHRIRQGPLPPHRVAIAEALTLGIRSDLDPTQVAAFRDAGLAHLLAVSGLHVGLIVLLVRWLLYPLGNRRWALRVRAAVGIVCVWFFAILTGLSASSTRAALMFSLFIISDVAHRRTPKMNLLAATALITLFIDPTALFDVGWQLSYCAVAALLMVRPLLTNDHSHLLPAITRTVAATLGTFPICLIVFGRVPLYFLPANLLLLPMASYLLAASLLYMIVPTGWTAIGVQALGGAVEWICSGVASLPAAVVDCSDLPRAACVGITVATWLLIAMPQIVYLLRRENSMHVRLSSSIY